MGCHFLLQGTFLTQGSNTSLLCLQHCRQILYNCTIWEALCYFVQSLSHIQLFSSPQQANFPVPHYIPEFAQTYVHWVGNGIQPSHPLLPPSPCPQSFPASGSFPMSQLFTSAGQNIGVSASTSVLPMNIKDWFSLGWTGWISLKFKGLSRVFSSTTIWKHQFVGAQPSLWSNSQVVTVVKNPPTNAGNVRKSGSIPGLEKYPGVGNGNPLLYSCLENPMDRGAWQPTVHRCTKSWTLLKQLSMHACSYPHMTTKKKHSFDYMHLCHQVMSLHFNTLSRFVIAFLS